MICSIYLNCDQEHPILLLESKNLTALQAHKAPLSLHRYIRLKPCHPSATISSMNLMFSYIRFMIAPTSIAVACAKNIQDVWNLRSSINELVHLQVRTSHFYDSEPGLPFLFKRPKIVWPTTTFSVFFQLCYTTHHIVRRSDLLGNWHTSSTANAIDHTSLRCSRHLQLITSVVSVCHIFQLEILLIINLGAFLMQPEPAIPGPTDSTTGIPASYMSSKLFPLRGQIYR